jgi:hypothetical protein
VASTASTPSGRVSAASVALEETPKYHDARRSGRRSSTQNTHSVSAKLKSAVSSPELSHASHVRFVTVPSSTRARNARRCRASGSGSRIRSTIHPASSNVAQPNARDSRLAESGGATPVSRHTPSRSTSHRKLV